MAMTHLSTFQSSLDLLAAGADLAKDIAILNGRGGGDRLAHESQSQEMDDAGNYAISFESQSSVVALTLGYLRHGFLGVVS